MAYASDQVRFKTSIMGWIELIIFCQLYSGRSHCVYKLIKVRMERRKKITNYMIWMDTKLGEGAFGKVYLGEADGTQRKVAIKMLEKAKIDKDEYFKNALFSEIEILKTLKCPNIVEFLDVMESNNYYYIIQQYCNGGQLRQYMNKVGRIPEKQAIGYLKQICNGFIELVQEGVMHRDLKPENILIHDGVLKISDFGFSKKGYSRISNQTVVGTPLYMPLQILKAAVYTSKCDIWSLGCVFYQMLHGRTPWTGNSEYQLIMNIQSKPLIFGSEVSDTTKSFLRKCLALEEVERFSWDQLFSHGIFQGKFEQCKSVENKFKSLMNHLRYMIKTKNIDLEKYFSNMNFTRSGYIKYPAFKNFVMYIDDHLEQDEVRYVFDRIVTKSSLGISYQELEKALMKFGIPMSMLKVQRKFFNQSPRNAKNELNSPGVFKQQTSLKLSNALFKLLGKLEDKKLTVYELFQAYRWDEKGYMDSNDFGKLLKLVDGTFSDQQIQTSFSLIDTNNRGAIPLDGFVKFFFTVTHLTNELKKQDSSSSSTSMNSLSYPVQYTNGNALLNLLYDQIQKSVLSPQMMATNTKVRSPNYVSPQKQRTNYQGGNGWF